MAHLPDPLEPPPRPRPAPPPAAPPPPPAARFALGHGPLDEALSGGLALGRLHEVHAATAADLAAATGFALMLALRAGGRAGHLVWLARGCGAAATGPLYPPGLAELGADPARLLLVTLEREDALLRAAGDIARTPAAGTLVVAPGPAPARLDLTATRRLTLLAERSGVTVLLLRGCAAPAPSAAASRWQVAAAPSAALAANAPGAPALAADLTRRRDGPPLLGHRLGWDRDALAFAALPGAVAAGAGRGRLAAG